MYDLLFRNARVVDGTGNPWFIADVGVEGDRITGLGDLSESSARQIIDLEGTILAPGFIDLHTHSDFTTPFYPRSESYITQGVTTQLMGNCGFSPFPVVVDKLELLQKYTAFLGAGLSYDWHNLDGYARYLESLPLSFNVALQVGHGSVRIAAMGFDRREPNLSELETMEKLVAKAMEEGAFGLSSGLIYVPGSYSQTPELVALAKVSARYGGFYSSHIRGEGATLIPAVEEALTVGREAGLAVQLSHHKASGTANWGMVNSSLRLIDEARAVGQDVLADQYPYTAGWTTLSALMPQWALEGGMEEMRRRFNDPETRSRIIKAISETDPDAGSSQFPVETITVCGIPEGPNKQYDGLPLSEIGKKRGENPVESALYLLANEPNGASIIVHTMSEEDVRQVMSHPAVAIGSDGYSVNPTIGSHLHPRAYGTYTRVLGHYVREEKVLRLEEAVRKMTSLPAQRLGRYDLGLVRPGCQADLVVFDPEQICDMATFSEPHRYSKGIKYVLVNGQIVIESGQDTGVNAGRVLRRNRE